jgi:hypothetical protein
MNRISLALVALCVCSFAATAQVPNSGGFGVPNGSSGGSSITIGGKVVPPGGTYAPARSNSSGASPGVGTTSGGVMAGLALTITPATSGNLFLTGNISGSNSTAVAGCTVQISWGTGAAPTHNAVATGTAVGSANVATSATAAASVAIPVSSYVTGLTVGTAYWIDLLYGQNGGGTCTISGFNMQALEQ